MNCTYIPLTVLRATGLKQVHKCTKNGYLIAQYTVPLNQFIMYKSEACGTLAPPPPPFPPNPSIRFTLSMNTLITQKKVPFS